MAVTMSWLTTRGVAWLQMAVTTLPCDESGLGPELEEEEPKAKKGKALEAQPAW
jgi:hypothetical protein